MFLSRLNEISGGCEKIVPVSESFWSNLKFLRMIDLTEGNICSRNCFSAFSVYSLLAMRVFGAGNNCAIVSRSGYILILSGARDQELTNHSARFVE